MTKKLVIICALLFSITAIAQNKKNEVLTIKTSAECDQCKKRLESNLIYEKGVKFCKLDVPSKVLTIKYNAEKTSPETIRLAVSQLGYDADGVPADSAKYANLPACCKKGGGMHK